MIVSGELENVPLLDVLQVLAYSQQSGILSVEGTETKGTVLFARGGIVGAVSTATGALLARASSEIEPRNRRALRRVQTLATLTELLALKKGIFKFKRDENPAAELDGIDMTPFYGAGTMETGELLLVLATTVDKKEEAPPAPPREPSRERSHRRYAPTLVQAELEVGSSKISGHLTNMSEGGAFFHGEALPEPDSRCQVRFVLPAEMGVVEASARVAWSRTDATEGKKGAGLSFEKMAEDGRARLRAFLARYEDLASDMTEAENARLKPENHRR